MNDTFAKVLILTALFFLLQKVLHYIKSKQKRKKSIPRSSSFAYYPIITIAANSILIDENFKLLPQISKSIDEIKATSTIYTIVKVNNQDDYEQNRIEITNELKSIIDENNILFCETNIGRSAMSRHLESSLLIDYDEETAILNTVFSPTALVTKSPNISSQIKWKAKDLKSLVDDQYQSFEHSKF